MKFFYSFLIHFLLIFCVIYLFYKIYLKKKKKDYNQLKKDDYIKAFIAKYNLDVKKTKYESILNTFAFNNAFSIAFTSALIINIKKTILKYAISFVVLFSLLYSLYELSGRYLKKKESN